MLNYVKSQIQLKKTTTMGGTLTTKFCSIWKIDVYFYFNGMQYLKKKKQKIHKFNQLEHKMRIKKKTIRMIAFQTDAIQYEIMYIIGFVYKRGIFTLNDTKQYVNIFKLTFYY